MDKSKVNLERLRAYDAEWEEDKHPRAENGQFTSGSGGSAGGSANGSSESSAKSHNLLAEPKSPLRQAAEAVQGESKWEHEQNIKLMEGLEKAEKNGEHKVVIGWIINDMRQGMSAQEAFAKADKDVQNGMVGGGPLGEGLLRKWWKKWSYKWGPQEEEG